MPFPPATLQDHFNRADGSIDGDLTSVGGWTWASPMHSGDAATRVASNLCVANTASARYDNACINHDFGSDLRASLTLDTLPTVTNNDSVSILLRVPYSSFPFSYGTGSTYYAVRFSSVSGTNNDDLYIDRYIDGSGTRLLNYGSWGDYGAGDEVAVEIREVAGSTVITVYRKPSGGSWAVFNSYTDSTAGRPLAGKKVGIEHDGGAASTPSAWKVDDFGVEPIYAGRGYKRLVGPRQLPTSAEDLYTAPAGTRARIRHLHVSNPSASAVDVTLSAGADAASTRILDGFPIAADSIYSPRRPAEYTLEPGEKIQGFSSAATTVIVVDGVTESL